MSTATVSRTLSGRGPVSDATRERVLRVAAALDYLPSAAARSLRTQRSLTIGVLVPDLANPVFVPFLRGVQHVAQRHGYVVLVVDAQRSPAVERLALRRLRAQGVDALVLAGQVGERSLVEELERGGIVVVDADLGAAARGSLIARLERPGTAAMCDALAAAGHRRVAYVTRGPARAASPERRWQAMRGRWRGRGVSLERVVLAGRHAPDEVGALLGSVLARPAPATALICATHTLAPIVLAGLRVGGFETPADCSFVTYGDSDWARAYRPALSVVALDLYEAARVMTVQTIRRLAGEEGPWSDALPPPARFVERESVGPPPR